MATVNTTCQVTNKSGKPIVVLDAYTSGTNIDNHSAAMGYQQALKVLALQAGGQIIADGATGAVTLDDTRISGGVTKPNYLYQLLVSLPDGLSPVMNVGQALDFDTMGYPPITVTADAAKNMSLAATFCQNIMAYPGSNLATGFITAMNTAQQAKTPSDMDKVISDYFNTTKSFRGLDFPSYVAVTSYLRAFAWTWGLDGIKPGRTYWMYANSDAGGGGTGKAGSSQGTLTFTAGPGGSVSDPTDPNSGYTIVLKPTDGSPATLTFSNGQVVNDPTVDVPTICLQGTYGLKSTFTQNSDDNVLWPMFVGTVNGKKIIAISQTPEHAAQGWLNSLLSMSWDDLFNSIVKVVGIWMAFDFVWGKLRGKENKLKSDKTNENGGREPDDRQREEADADADAIEQEALEQNRADAARFGEQGGEPVVDVPGPADLPAEQAAGNAAEVDALNGVAADNYKGGIDEYQGELRELAQIEVNGPLEDAEGNLIEANAALPEARQSGEFADVKSSMADAKVSINDGMEELGGLVSEELKLQIDESQSAAKEYEETADEVSDTADKVEGGEEEFKGEPIEFEV